MTDKSETYYVTVSPNPRRIFGGRSYAAAIDTRQRALIMKAINNAARWCRKPMEISMIHFEYNKKMMIHAHFKVAGSQRVVQRFQKFVNTGLGNEKLAPEIAVHLCHWSQWVPKTNPLTGERFKSWLEYCNKENVLPPLMVSCMCVTCKYERNDAIITRKVEEGDITLPMDDY